MLRPQEDNKASSTHVFVPPKSRPSSTEGRRLQKAQGSYATSVVGGPNSALSTAMLAAGGQLVPMSIINLNSDYKQRLASAAERNSGNRSTRNVSRRRGGDGPQSWTTLTSRPSWLADVGTTPNADAEVERLEVSHNEASTTPSASMIVTKETASLATRVVAVAAERDAAADGEDEISQHQRELRRRACAKSSKRTCSKHVQYTKKATPRRISAPAADPGYSDRKHVCPIRSTDKKLPTKRHSQQNSSVPRYSINSSISGGQAERAQSTTTTKRRVRFSESSPQIFGQYDLQQQIPSDDNNNRRSVNERPSQPPRSTSVISMASEQTMLLQNNMQEANNCDPIHMMIVNDVEELVVEDGEEEEDEDDDEEDIDTRFLDVCVDGDVEDLVQLLEEMARARETLGPDILNCVDPTGRSPVSHLCANGMIEMLDLLEDIPGIDYNVPDNEGNTPLHYAAQAGHVEVVSFLLNKVRTIQVDPINQQGFTPLMKAALQGRIKCSKLLLFSGASPVRRDYGRGYTAQQWARFCGRYLCAESIEKFVRTAVPGGAALIADSSGPSLSQLSKKTAKGQNGEKKGHLRLRSRSASGAKNASWLTRTFKKAFNSHGDSAASVDGDSEADLANPRPRKETKSLSLKSKGGRERSKKFVIPQVQVTPTNNASSGDPEVAAAMTGAAGRKMDAISGGNSASMATSEKKKKKFGGTSLVSRKWS